MSLKKKQEKPSGMMVNEKRRGFLKQVVYAAPTVVVLGALMKPTETKAGHGKPPSGPTWS